MGAVKNTLRTFESIAPCCCLSQVTAFSAFRKARFVFAKKHTAPSYVGKIEYFQKTMKAIEYFQFVPTVKVLLVPKDFFFLLYSSGKQKILRLETANPIKLIIICKLNDNVTKSQVTSRPPA